MMVARSALSLCLLLTGCAALKDAAPLVAPLALSATEALIRSQLQDAPAAQAVDLAAALALLEECRQAKVAAELAQHRAEEAADMASDSAAVAAAHSRAAEASARAARLEASLARALLTAMPDQTEASAPQ